MVHTIKIISPYNQQVVISNQKILKLAKEIIDKKISGRFITTAEDNYSECV